MENEKGQNTEKRTERGKLEKDEKVERNKETEQKERVRFLMKD